MRHIERHLNDRIGWLRASVLGANDGIVSTASLILGVAAANASQSSLILAGAAGLVAGAMSMATGEYVSVSSQSDTEHADIERERQELIDDPIHEHAEMAAIYMARGLDRNLASQVATQLMAHDALGAHTRDELGILEAMRANPLQAAAASACSFAVGAGLPLLIAALTPKSWLFATVMIVSLLSLALLGAISAHLGGAARGKAALRITFWSALAMLATTATGYFFGALA